MTEENTLEEAQVLTEEERQEEDELYAVVSDGRSKAITTAQDKGVDDDSPYHKIDYIHDVPLRLSVEIGQTQLSVREILGLELDRVVEFSKVVGEPMDITVSGRLMARGEVVVVNERYGVRISEVTRPDEIDATE